MKKKLINTILCATFISSLVPAVVNAEVLTDLGTTTSDATISGIKTSDTYEINISWGGLSYSYSKVAEDTYVWVPYMSETEFGRSSNYVEIENLSTQPVNASISWQSSIDGVTAKFAGIMETEGDTTCKLSTVDEVPYTWGKGGNTYISTWELGNPPIASETFYTENTCTTEVTEGTEYVSNTFYINEQNTYDVSSTITSIEAKKYLNDELLTTKLTWNIDLEGGTLEDVQEAYATEEKKIGTVTITISNQE